MSKPFKTSIHASMWGQRWDAAGIEAFSRSRLAPDHGDALAVWHDAFEGADALAASAFAVINRASDHAV
jgi:hypothetical protein